MRALFEGAAAGLVLRREERGSQRLSATVGAIRSKASHALSFHDDLVMGLRLLCRLPAYLRNPLTIAEARTILRRRLERREDDFVELVRRTIYVNRASPYRALLHHAGCEFGDMEGLVRQEGVEGALHDAGFTSVLECHVPFEPGKPSDRITLAALKGVPVLLSTYPWVNHKPEVEVERTR
jgi:hypothetical protein